MSEKWNQNIESLWNVIIHYLNSEKIELNTRQLQIIQSIFNTEIQNHSKYKYHFKKYTDINKNILQIVHKQIQQFNTENDRAIQNTHQIKTQQIQLKERHDYNEVPLITNEQIKESRSRSLQENYNKIQDEFNSFHKKPVPKQVTFDDDTKDEPIQNMDELIRKELESRKYDIIPIDISNSVTNTKLQDVNIKDSSSKPETEPKKEQEKHLKIESKKNETELNSTNITSENNENKYITLSHDTLENIYSRIDHLENTIKFMGNKLRLLDIIGRKLNIQNILTHE
jgi:hypothetical protein